MKNRSTPLVAALSLAVSAQLAPSATSGAGQFGFSVDLASGGTATFNIEMGVAHGGDYYWLLDSASGTYPGLVLFPLTLPLNFDFGERRLEVTVPQSNGNGTHGM